MTQSIQIKPGDLLHWLESDEFDDEKSRQLSAESIYGSELGNPVEFVAMTPEFDDAGYPIITVKILKGNRNFSCNWFEEAGMFPRRSSSAGH